MAALTLPDMRLTTSRWRSIATVALAGAVGCATVEGDVRGYDSATAAVPDVDVLLVKRSDSLFAALKRYCSEEKAGEARRDAERKRLEREAADLKDSASAVYGLEYQSPRWQRLMAASQAATDSSNRIPIANVDPIAVAEQNARYRGHSDQQGHYRITGVRPGRYFVVPFMRESEFAPLQWYPTSVFLGTKRFDTGGNEGSAACYIPGVESPDAERR